MFHGLLPWNKVIRNLFLREQTFHESNKVMSNPVPTTTMYPKP